MAAGLGGESFDFYEGTRITLPGALLTALIEGTLRSVDPVGPLSIASNPIAALAFAIGAGFLLYFIDVPAKSAVYAYGQPTEVIAGWYPAIQGRNKARLYFAYLDTNVPPLIRTRALYMGTIFRIGFEAILLIALFQYGLWAYAVLKRSEGGWNGSWAYVSALVVLGVIFVGRALASAIRATSRPQWISWKSMRKVLRNTHRDLGFWGEAFLLLGVVAMAIGLVWRSPSSMYVTLLGAFLVAVQWALRFIWGRQIFSRNPPRPIYPFTSLLLFATPTAALIAEAGLQTDALNKAASLGWLGASLLVALLISSRGHERRLGGAYASQREWLQLNARTVKSWLDARDPTLR